MTVGELRKELEGVPDDYEVDICEDTVNGYGMPAKCITIYSQSESVTIEA